MDLSIINIIMNNRFFQLIAYKNLVIVLNLAFRIILTTNIHDITTTRSASQSLKFPNLSNLHLWKISRLPETQIYLLAYMLFRFQIIDLTSKFLEFNVWVFDIPVFVLGKVRSENTWIIWLESSPKVVSSWWLRNI